MQCQSQKYQNIKYKKLYNVRARNIKTQGCSKRCAMSEPDIRISKDRDVSIVVECLSQKYQNIKGQGSIKSCEMSEPEISEYQRAKKYQKLSNVRARNISRISKDREVSNVVQFQS